MRIPDGVFRGFVLFLLTGILVCQLFTLKAIRDATPPTLEQVRHAGKTKGAQYAEELLERRPMVLVRGSVLID